MEEITTVGIDLAKNVFSVHGVDAHGKTVLRKTLSRGALLELMAQLPPCLVGMEACSGAHQLARDLQPLGYQPHIMMPNFIIPDPRSQKNDGNDAEAISEAASRSAATLVAAPDQRDAAWPNSELGSRVRLVWRLASASTTPQGRLHRCSPLLADESTSAQSTMTLQRFALKLSCCAAPCCRGWPEPASSVRAASRDRCARPAAALDSFTFCAAREEKLDLPLTI